MEYIKLSDCASFRESRTNNITLENYITTENMLPNKGGITKIDSLPSVKAASKYEIGDILLSNIRPYFCKIWHANRVGSCSNDVLVVQVNENHSSKFIYYVLSDKNFFNYSTVTSKGTKMPRGTPKAIMKYLVPAISIESENIISDILSKYDELIEVNNQRIKKLEQTAEELYKEWFVRFRFPNWQNTEFEKSSLGRIPSSFKVLKMSDVISYYIGGGWGADVEDSSYPQKAYVIRGTDFPKVEKGDVSSVPCRYHKESNYRARSLKENDIVIEISGGTAEQPVGRAILITKQILNRLDNMVICASFCKQIRLNTEIISPIYYLYWMKFLYDTRMIERYQLQSTGIINFKFEYFLKKGDVLLPPMELMNSFSQKVSKIKEQIDTLAMQNDNLIKQRDLLLPRLMSGKLEV